MAKYQYGCTKVEEGIMNATTGAVTWAPAEVAVYQNTITIDQPEAQKTEHYQQGKTSPAVIRYGRTAKTISFSVMDLSADSKVSWLGGTKTTVESVDTWHEPTPAVSSKKKAMRFTLEDGSVITTPNLDCAARLTGNANDTDILLIPVVGTVLETGVTAVSGFSWTD